MGQKRRVPINLKMVEYAVEELRNYFYVYLDFMSLWPKLLIFLAVLSFLPQTTST